MSNPKGRRQTQHQNNDNESSSVSSGTPRIPDRNFKRRAAYNQMKAGNSWSDRMDNDQKEEEALSRPAKPRPPRFRKNNKPQKSEGPVKSETPSPPSNVILYEGQARGGRATTYVNSQNFSYSAFPVLVREMYTLLTTNETTLTRSLPFCAFQHYLCTILNATIIKRTMMYNVEQRFSQEVDPYEVIGADKLWIPIPFLEYMNGIGPALTASGDKVFLNLPEQGIPRNPLRVGQVDIASGSFGTVNAANHNAYEEYVSPLVTSNLITRTIGAFADNNYAAWDPLPGLSPEGGAATPNLLGYELPEHIRGETLNILNRFNFANTASMAGRLRHSPELMEHVSSMLQGRSDKFQFKRGVPAESGVNAAAFIISEVCTDQVSTTLLSRNHGTLTDHEQFSASAANMSTYFTYKRRRNADAPGVCYLANGAILAGWEETMNSNLEMVYAPMYGADFPHLRSNRFEETSSPGYRDADTRLWLDKVFRISN